MNKNDLIEDLRAARDLIRAAYDLTDHHPVAQPIIEMAYEKIHPWISRLIMNDEIMMDCCKKHWLHGGQCE